MQPSYRTRQDYDSERLISCIDDFFVRRGLKRNDIFNRDILLKSSSELEINGLALTAIIAFASTMVFLQKRASITERLEDNTLIKMLRLEAENYTDADIDKVIDFIHRVYTD